MSCRRPLNRSTLSGAPTEPRTEPRTDRRTDRRTDGRTGTAAAICGEPGLYADACLRSASRSGRRFTHRPPRSTLEPLCEPMRTLPGTRGLFVRVAAAPAASTVSSTALQPPAQGAYRQMRILSASRPRAPSVFRQVVGAAWSSPGMPSRSHRLKIAGRRCWP